MTSALVSVLIIGAGPTGLVLALWLTKLGVKVRIIDKTAESGTTSRALAVQARTLELYRQLDLADFVVEHGHKVPAVNLWVKGEPAARLAFEAIGKDLTAYPFLEIFPRCRHWRSDSEPKGRHAPWGGTQEGPPRARVCSEALL
jgi:2-polyprenyl-6-methoxyphenol hydroxylase-like FAD-dependent oxidoreductase